MKFSSRERAVICSVCGLTWPAEHEISREIIQAGVVEL